jgi:branched-chain amino acid transport system ATP-binding protein
MLTVNGLSAGYGRSQVLQHVEFSVSPGEIVGLVGLNGCGKTTTLRAVSGVIKRTGGSVSLDGKEVPVNPRRVVSVGIAHVPENRQLFPTLSVDQNIRFGAYAANKPWDAAKRSRLREMFPRVDQLFDRKAATLSGGEQQLVAIARGVAAEPRILLIDEASLGLAPRMVTDVMESVAALVESTGTGVLLVDQNVRLLQTRATSLYQLIDGVTEQINVDDANVAARML